MPNAPGWGKRAPRIGLAAVVLLCPSAAADSAVHFRTVGDRLVVVPVRVNGEGPFDFLLDTGTNTITVDLGLARQLGLRPIDRVSVVSPGGITAVPRALLRSVALGPKSLEGVEALCQDLGGMRGLDRSVRGFLGQAFLSRFNYLLSYKDRRLEFVEPEAAGPGLHGVELPFDDDEGRIVVPTTASRDAPPRRFVLDSGASAAVLFVESSRGLGADVEERDGTVGAVTAQGSLQLRAGSIRRLIVGGQRFEDLPVVLVSDGQGAEGRNEDGLLPTSLFRAVYFNNRDGFVLLNPRR